MVLIYEPTRRSEKLRTRIMAWGAKNAASGYNLSGGFGLRKEKIKILHNFILIRKICFLQIIF